MEINMNSEEKNIVSETDTPEEQKTEKKKPDPEKLFPKRLEKVSSFYLFLVIMCTAALGIADSAYNTLFACIHSVIVADAPYIRAHFLEYRHGVRVHRVEEYPA